LDRPPSSGAGPWDAARALGQTALALLRARVELVGVELGEEAERRKRQLLLGVVAAVFLFAGLILVAFLVVVLFWDTWRVGAIATVTFAYLAIGAWALLRLRAALRDSPPPFSATLAEFRNDLDMLKGHDEQA
jgi:uncharacterized membrane protein YqjE